MKIDLKEARHKSRDLDFSHSTAQHSTAQHSTAQHGTITKLTQNFMKFHAVLSFYVISSNFSSQRMPGTSNLAKSEDPKIWAENSALLYIFVLVLHT